MTNPKPHFLLFCDGNVPALGGESVGSQRGRWRFVLEDLASGERVEATDQESGCAPDRTALVAVLRGLEALEQPSRVTLVTTSRYVTRGLQYGISEWRENDYTWEHFGAVQPIRNADIWKRIDRALAFHQVQCRWMAQDVAEITEESPQCDDSGEMKSATASQVAAVATMLPSTVLASTSLPSTAHPTHRPPQKLEGARTTVSTSKYQRVYVDTPCVGGPVAESNHRAVNLDLAYGSPNEGPGLNQQNARSLPSLFEKSSWSLNRIAHGCLWPLRIVFRVPVWLCCHSWEAILAIDEWLESFLRCLLLLDPSKKPTRH